MAVVSFGVDLALLKERYFGSVDLGARWQTTASVVVEEVASDVGTRLRGLGVEPADVTEASSPLSYRWLQTTILYGAAAEVGRRLGAAEVDAVDSWDEKFAARMRDLATNSGAVLVDLPARAAKTRTLHAFR